MGTQTNPTPTSAAPPAPDSTTPDMYDPKNPSFVNPNDVLATNPNDVAAQQASLRVDVILATAKRQVQAQIVLMNGNLKAIYLNAFAPWLYGWQNGAIKDRSTAPVPPMAFVVGYFATPSSPNIQWAYPAVGTVPVCPQPAIPDPDTARGPNFIHILGRMPDSDNWFECGQDDTCLPGFPTPPGFTAGDGTTGTFVKYGAPVGPGWWLRTGN